MKAGKEGGLGGARTGLSAAGMGAKRGSAAPKKAAAKKMVKKAAKKR
jgi:hypothetical protein